MSHNNDLWTGSGSGSLKAKTPLRNLNEYIRFTFKQCDFGTKYCIKNLGKKELGTFYKRLGHFEQMTFQQVNGIDPKKGFDLEDRDSPNDVSLRKKHGAYDKFLHFRVNGAGVVIRIFAGIKGPLVYILEVDREGKRNKSAH